jgi:hypothetical protein
MHDDSTILKDFLDFIDENTLTFSFKLIFLLSLFKTVNQEGEANLDLLLDEYISFYVKRINKGLPVDRPRCLYTQDYLKDKTLMKQSLLDNPFEKFERKRFVYFSKDLNIIVINPALWPQLTNDIKDDIINKVKGFLSDYYKNLGGLTDE